MEDAKRYGNEAISLAQDPVFDQFVWAFADLAMVAAFEGNIERAIEILRTGSEHSADRGDRFCLAFLLYFIAAAGRIDEATKMAGWIVAAVDATGVPSSISLVYWAKGEAFSATDPAVALQAYEHASTVARRSGNRFWELMVIPKVAVLQARSGHPVAALGSFRQMLNASRRSADLMFASHGIGSLIALFERIGQTQAAATLHGFLSPMFDTRAFLPEFPQIVARLRLDLGDATFDAERRKGEAMAQHEAAEYALVQITSALAALGVKDEKSIREALH